MSALQLPSLDDERPVTDDELAVYREDGHVVIRGLATEEEIAAWRPVLGDAASGLALDDRPLEQRDAIGRAFLQQQNLWVSDEQARRFVFARRFGRIAADLLGVDRVRMYHDQALFKEPGGGPTPFHQDMYYFPLDGDQVITMWMPLVPVPEEVGSLAFASGTHRTGPLGSGEASDKSDAEYRAVIEDRGLSLCSYGAMRPGDATFHGAWTLHGAPGNPTDATREVMTIIWFADGLRGVEPEHEWHEKDYAKWLPDVRPGEPAAGRLNPLVWTRQ